MILEDAGELISMGKVESLDEYILQCDVVKQLGRADKSIFIDKIVCIFEGEIPTITNRLDSYGFYSEGKQSDLDGDIDKIYGILVNYKNNIDLEVCKRKDELELARLGQSNIHLNNTSTNTVSNTNSINIHISIEQAIELMNQIPDEVISQEEKNDLEDKLSGIEQAVKTGKKDRAKDKIVGVLKFLADKGADALIVMLPYLGQMAGLLNSVQ